MNFFTDLRLALDALESLLGDDIAATEVPVVARTLADDGVVSMIECASVLVRAGESLRIAGSGVVAARSARERGHGGLAQKRGHRSPVSLIQDLTGTTRADAAKQVRLGEALAAGLADADADADADVPMSEGSDAVSPAIADVPPPRRPWHAPLGDALMSGVLTSAQHDAIYRGLGAPPAPVDGVADASATSSGALAGDDASPLAGGAADAVDAREAADAEAEAEAILLAWSAAVTQLIDEAHSRTVEELGAAARTIRDLLDPAGAQRRFDERFQGRSFRMWTDRDGIRRGSLTFDDEAAAWVASIIDTALRPRRGGPRFVDASEKARAEELVADPRTNDQLTYDLVIDVLRAGALAEAKAVFGTRQAGVRLILTADAATAVTAGAPAVGLVEDDSTALPAWLITQHACDTGTTTCTLDRAGNPLDLGREQRLFSSKQRIALAIRDGGCRWKDCDRPASYCEAHHIDHYAEGGCTDVDRGILLCRFHHMQLHHGGWRITREGKGDFLLHPPDGGPPIILPVRLARRYAWRGLLSPPSRLLHPAA